ncbi:hypothetical protein BHU09_01580 [Tannerella sp. oral taxon 808]|nr:hypothetical protein BHU09_01580 [Tannerella sp. oral taxon 808]
MADSTIITGQYVQIEQTPASLGARVLGRLIDMLLMGAYCGAIIGAWMLYRRMNSDPSEIEVVLMLTVCLLPIMGYSFLWETFYNGQTPGKRLLGTRVVMKDGSRPSVGAYLLRWLLLLIDLQTSYVGLLCIALTKNNQRLGDLAAGTIVIKEKDFKKIHVTLDEFSHLDREYRPIFPQAERLSLAQVDLINRTLSGGDRRDRPSRISELAGQVRSYLHIEAATPDEVLLRTLVRDYQYYALESVI